MERIKTRCRLRSFSQIRKKIGTQKWLKKIKILYVRILCGIFVSWDFFLFVEGTEMTVYEVRKQM